MPIRLSGMNSGLDTESIISELVKAKSQKKDKLIKAQTKLEWKQEAWKDLNSKVYALYSKTLSNMRIASDYMMKTTKVGNSAAATVITGAEAVNGVQTLKIENLATSGYLTGGEIKGDKKLSGSSSLMSDLGIEKGSKIEITSGGTTKVIEVDESTTINSFVKSLKEAGVNANFDEKNQRFFISAKKTGKDNDFTLKGVNASGEKALDAMRLSTAEEVKERYGEYAEKNSEGEYVISSSKLSEYTEKEFLAKVARTNEIKEKISDLSARKNELNDKNLDTVENLEAKLRDFEDKDNKEQLLEEKTNELNALPEDASEDEKNALRAEIAEINASIQELKDRINTYDSKDNIEAQLAERKEFDSLIAEEEKLNDELEQVEGYLNWDDTSGYSANDKLLAEVKAVFDYAVNELNKSAGGATRIVGENAKIILNDAVFESDTNTFAINGLTITANMETDEAFTLTTSDDTDGIYDMIKNFLKEYNTLINEMDSLYNADAAKGYEPLTEEEKDAMSEKEIEKWEEKIKDSLLRRDPTLSNVSSAMKTIMLQGVKMKDGTQVYLSDFGISTLGYFSAADNEKNAYHIDGDKDDKYTSGNTDKLKTAIANEPEKVIEFFSSLTKELYTKLGDLMKKTEFSSSFTLYDDVTMKDEYNDYKDKISKQEQLIADYEDRYYKKFTAMETALAKIQSKESSISGLFGM